MRDLEWRPFFPIDKWTNSCHTFNSGNLLPKLAVIGQRCYEERLEGGGWRTEKGCIDARNNMLPRATDSRVVTNDASKKKKLRAPNENPLLPRSTPDPHQQIVAYILKSERVTLYAFERWLVRANRGLGQFRQAKKKYFWMESGSESAQRKRHLIFRGIIRNRIVYII